MKFVKQPPQHSASAEYSGNATLEDYIFHTNEVLDQQLDRIYTPHTDNITPKQRKAIDILQRSRDKITIKAADKNLGLVIMDTDEYVYLYITVLMDQNVYRLPEGYPHQRINIPISTIFNVS